VADVLSGDVEPYGRLAQQWPVDEAQAGDIFDYDTHAQKATYRHTEREPRFAFGHGLTYGRVSYDGVALSADSVEAASPSLRHAPLHGDGVTARVTVTNAGERPADELVQVYALFPQGVAGPAPRRLLLGYRRVRLAPGETRVVEVGFDVARLGLWDPAARVPGAPSGWLHQGALRVLAGEYRVAAGASASALPVSAALTVTSA
jgi:beta-glucosidase